MTEMQVYRLLGRAVAKRRKELGLTQADVGRRIGLSRASLANIETGRQKVLLHQVYRLAYALKMKSMNELVPKSLDAVEQPDKTKKFGGSPINAAQQSQLEALIARALARSPGKS